MNDILRKALLESYQLAPSEIDESDGWFVFRINAHNYQAGEADGELRLIIDLHEIDHEADFDVVYNAVQKANRELDGDILMGEEDNYFKILFSLRPDQVTEKDLPEWLNEMANVANTPTVGAVVGEFRQW